jgi:hypothetical protein
MEREREKKREDRIRTIEKRNNREKNITITSD